MKQPLINVEEDIGRFVGRRRVSPDALSGRKAFGGVRMPRGVYRFKSHQEADQWLWRRITRPTN